MRFGTGQPVRRREDVRLVAGLGAFLDDTPFAGELRAVFVRSPAAHAILQGVDSTEAMRMEGVAARPHRRRPRGGRRE